MFPRRASTVRLAFHLIHLGYLCAAFSLAVWARFSSGWWEIRDQPHLPAYGAFLLVSAALWSLLARYYQIDSRLFQEPDYAAWARACAQAVAVSAVVTSGVAFCYRGYSFSRIAIALFWTLHLAATLASGVVVFRLRRRIAAQFRPTRLLVIGSHPRLSQLVAGGASLEFLRPDQEQEIRALRNAPRCDETLVALAAEEIARLPWVLEALQGLPAPVRVALDLPGASAVRRAGDLLLADIGLFPADRFSYAVAKRALDIVIASAALALGAPLAALVVLAIKASSSGPALFRHERIGSNGRRFTLYKFRTLPVEPPEVSDRRWSDTAPPEAGRVGRLLRRLGLDEWPQFWNVLRGEMSVVGPRPERPHFAQGFRQALETYSLRERLKPGITGWAQIHGLTGASNISRRLEHDLYYLRHWSLGLDMKILLLTPLRALRRRRLMAAAPADVHPIPEVRDHVESF